MTDHATQPVAAPRDVLEDRLRRVAFGVAESTAELARELAVSLVDGDPDGRVHREITLAKERLAADLATALREAVSTGDLASGVGGHAS